MNIPDQERTRCEVYTRVMGYHRPTRDFNPGKLQEHEDRQHYVEALAFPEDEPEDE